MESPSCSGIHYYCKYVDWVSWIALTLIRIKFQLIPSRGLDIQALAAHIGLICDITKLVFKALEYLTIFMQVTRTASHFH
jgi:hypothetical protein